MSFSSTARSLVEDVFSAVRDRLVAGPTARRGGRKARRKPLPPACETLEIRILPTVSFTVAFDDPGGTQSAHYAELQQIVLAAGAQWAQYLDGTATLDVVVGFANFGGGTLATGGAETSVFVDTINGNDIFQVGTIAEVATGVDPNGATPDIRITIDVNSLNNVMFLDPTPFDTSDPVPFNKPDAVSVMVHEIGHSLGFSGFSSEVDGSLPGFGFTYDLFVTFDGSNFFFTGPQAMTTYGGPVPLTFGSNSHLGNSAPRPGSALVDVMNPVAPNGVRSTISALDLAILADIGMPIVGRPNTQPDVAPSISVNKLTIEQGQSVILGAGNLNAVDPDNSPAQLVYTVGKVTGGRFEFVSNPGVAITSFTQANINAGAVRFVADGGQAAPSYMLTVSDGSLTSGISSAAVSFTPLSGTSVMNGTLYAYIPAGTRMVMISTQKGRRGAPDQLVVKAKGQPTFVVNASQVNNIVVTIANSSTKVKVAKNVSVPVKVNVGAAQRIPTPGPVDSDPDIDAVFANLDALQLL